MNIAIAFIIFVLTTISFVVGINEGWGFLVFISALILGGSSMLGLVEIVTKALKAYGNYKFDKSLTR